MRWNTSWSKKELFKQNFRQAGWLSVGYTIALLLLLIMSIFSEINRMKESVSMYQTSFDTLFYYGGFIQVILLLGVPTLTGMVLLRFLHKQDASDFIHGLPMTRKMIYLNQISFGFIALILPILINGLILMFIYYSVDGAPLIYTLPEVSQWVFHSLSIALLVYAVSILIGILTGVTLIQLIFTMILLFLPAGFVFLLFYNLNFALIGLSSNYWLEQYIHHLSPITDMERLYTAQTLSWSKVWIYFFVTFVILSISYFLYKRRPVEAATQAISFTLLKPIFIYSFTFCFTLVGGFYSFVFRHNMLLIIVTYLIFSIIGYYISQMIVEKSWRVFTKIKPYTYFFAGMLIFGVLVSLDVTGYVNRIPDTDEITQAYFIDDIYTFNSRQDYYGVKSGFTEDENIDRIRELHQQLLDEASRDDFMNNAYQRVRIQYELTNGNRVTREYYVQEEQMNWLRDLSIKESSTYIRYTDSLYYINERKAQKIIFSGGNGYKELAITNRDEIVKIIEALREDRLQVYENETYTHNYLEIIMPGESDVYVDLSFNYANLIEYLESHELLDEAMIGPDDLARVEVFPILEDLYYYDYNEYQQKTEPEQIITVDDSEQVTTIFEHIGQYEAYEEEADYMVMVFLKQRHEPLMYSVGRSFEDVLTR